MEPPVCLLLPVWSAWRRPWLPCPAPWERCRARASWAWSAGRRCRPRAPRAAPRPSRWSSRSPSLKKVHKKEKPILTHYREVHLLADLSWVDFLFWQFHLLPGSAWADGKLAELAVWLGRLVEHPKFKSTELHVTQSARRWTSHVIIFSSTIWPF